MRRRRGAAVGEGISVELDIVSLGARGDGVARHDGIEIYVPFTVPGDRIIARLAQSRGDGRAASIEKLLVPGPGRGAAICRHFGTCGGCALQHLDPGLYAATKRELVRSALARQGFVDAPVAPVQLCGGALDPLVFFFNTQLMQHYWSTQAPPSQSIAAVDLEATPANDPYASLKQGFAIAKAAIAADAVAQGATDGGAFAVAEAYHALLVAPFCMAATRSFFAKQ